MRAKSPHGRLFDFGSAMTIIYRLQAPSDWNCTDAPPYFGSDKVDDRNDFHQLARPGEFDSAVVQYLSHTSHRRQSHAAYAPRTL